MKQDSILPFLGLAFRGRNLVWGEKTVLTAIRDKVARVVLVASDASENTVSRITHRASERGIPVFELISNKAELGASLGKGACASVAITDAGIALSVLEKLDPEGNHVETAKKLEKMKRRKSLKAKRRK
ncbi:MAG: hypothetical protein GX257_09580 [Clostridiales bacterium]|jgi:ribosomal protein L7Ae-like RNA K-turn-binding protein|nr:hypothetical protein [Clostridiales bacterium]